MALANAVLTAKQITSVFDTEVLTCACFLDLFSVLGLPALVVPSFKHGGYFSPADDKVHARCDHHRPHPT